MDEFVSDGWNILQFRRQERRFGKIQSHFKRGTAQGCFRVTNMELDNIKQKWRFIQTCVTSLGLVKRVRRLAKIHCGDKKSYLQSVADRRKIHKRAPTVIIPSYSKNSERWLRFLSITFIGRMEIGEDRDQRKKLVQHLIAQRKKCHSD